jgi:hypothetical protein
MAIRHYLWLPCPASRSRTHPPYGNRSRAICPEKSTGVPELLRWIYGSRPLMAAQRRVIVMELVQRRKRARGGDAKDCAVIVIAPTHKG